tara:strand:+ start:12408 stop:12833 length:426 start_codon:yes stop_codon:yes gene_type:complete
MRFIRDEYVTVFRECLIETSRQEGFTLPEDIEAYVAILLGSFIDEPDFLPSPTFTEAYIKGTMPSKDLADVCLFVRGVFPKYGDKNYLTTIGKSSYDNASKQLRMRMFEDISNNFETVVKVIRISTRPAKLYFKDVTWLNH